MSVRCQVTFIIHLMGSDTLELYALLCCFIKKEKKKEKKTTLTLVCSGFAPCNIFMNMHHCIPLRRDPDACRAHSLPKAACAAPACRGMARCRTGGAGAVL